MKRHLFFLATLFVSTVSFAQLNGDGYYRVQNKVTSRYVKVVDDKGKIDIASTSADFGAIKTVKGFESVVSDPGTIIYFQKVSAGYNLKTQGTDTHSIIGYYPQIKDNKDGTYKAYASKNGMVAYLADELSYEDEGIVVSNEKTTRDWYIKPVTLDESLYFGLTPDLKATDGYYQTFYAAFPFSFAGNDMKAWYISMVDSENGVAVWEEIEGDIPISTPVIVRCASSSAVNNKLDIHESAKTTIKTNHLKGVYFNNPKKAHLNQVANDTATMRVLTVLPEGNVAFVKSTDTYMQANRAYLPVAAGSASTFQVMTSDEYTAYLKQLEEERQKQKKVTSITLNPSSVELMVGENVLVSTEVLPLDAYNPTLAWSTSDSSVATVVDGMVEAISSGEAIISASAVDGSGVSATCRVVVKENTPAVITIKVDDAEKTYGEANPTWTFTLLNAPDGFTVADFTKQPLITTSAQQYSDAGTYALVASGAEAPNCTFQYVDGLLTIRKASQTISCSVTEVELEENGSSTIEASATSGLPLSHSVSNGSVVMVSSNGSSYLLQALSAGTSIVTFSQKGNSNYEAAAESKVSVKVLPYNGILTPQMVVEDDVLDLLGRKVTDVGSLKGIYIVNGRKKVF